VTRISAKVLLCRLCGISAAHTGAVMEAGGRREVAGLDSVAVRRRVALDLRAQHTQSPLVWSMPPTEVTANEPSSSTSQRIAHHSRGEGAMHVPPGLLVREGERDAAACSVDRLAQRRADDRGPLEPELRCGSMNFVICRR